MKGRREGEGRKRKEEKKRKGKKRQNVLKKNLHPLHQLFLNRRRIPCSFLDLHPLSIRSTGVLVTAYSSGWGLIYCWHLTVLLHTSYQYLPGFTPVPTFDFRPSATNQRCWLVSLLLSSSSLTDVLAGESEAGRFGLENKDTFVLFPRPPMPALASTACLRINPKPGDRSLGRRIETETWGIERSVDGAVQSPWYLLDGVRRNPYVSRVCPSPPLGEETLNT